MLDIYTEEMAPKGGCLSRVICSDNGERRAQLPITSRYLGSNNQTRKIGYLIHPLADKALNLSAQT